MESGSKSSICQADSIYEEVILPTLNRNKLKLSPPKNE